MDFKLKFAFDLPEALTESLGIDEDTAFEAYFEEGKIVVNTLSDEDIDSLLCGDDDCPFGKIDCEGCENFCPYCGECIYDDEN